MTDAELRAALERHKPVRCYLEGCSKKHCSECGSGVEAPCDAARALEEIDRLGLALHVARREDITRADAAEAQVAALLQDKAAAHARAEEREAELDLAIAHDRQLYPTAALDRVERAEAEVERLKLFEENSDLNLDLAASYALRLSRAEAALTVGRVARRWLLLRTR